MSQYNTDSAARRKHENRRATAYKAIAAAGVLALAAGCRSTGSNSEPLQPVSTVVDLGNHVFPDKLPSAVKEELGNAVSIIVAQCAQPVKSAKNGSECGRVSQTVSATFSGVDLGGGKILTAGHALDPKVRSDANPGNDYIASVDPTVKDKTYSPVNQGHAAYVYQNSLRSTTNAQYPDVALIELNNNLAQVGLLSHGIPVADITPDPGTEVYIATWQPVDGKIPEPYAASPYNQPSVYAGLVEGEASNGTMLIAAGFKSYTKGEKTPALDAADRASGGLIMNSNGELLGVLDGVFSPAMTQAEIKQITGADVTNVPSSDTIFATLVTEGLINSLTTKANNSAPAKFTNAPGAPAPLRIP